MLKIHFPMTWTVRRRVRRYLWMKIQFTFFIHSHHPILLLHLISIAVIESGDKKWIIRISILFSILFGNWMHFCSITFFLLNLSNSHFLFELFCILFFLLTLRLVCIFCTSHLLLFPKNERVRREWHLKAGKKMMKMLPKSAFINNEWHALCLSASSSSPRL